MPSPLTDPISDSQIQIPIDRVRAIIVDALSPESEPMLLAIKHQTATVGKMVRAQLLLLTASSYCSEVPTQTVSLAAAIEIAHMATLLHDDVIDQSARRREKPTLNVVLGNKASILCGDYLLARALNLLSEHGTASMIKAVTSAVSRVLEGEFLQHHYGGTWNLDDNTYLDIAKQKTGQMFAVAAELGAALSAAPTGECDALSKFGLLLGTAFQLADDFIDYAGSTKHNGKPVGADIRSGFATLPLLQAVRNASPQERARLRCIFGRDRLTDRQFKDVLQIIRRYNGLSHAADMARHFVKEAMACLEVVSLLKTRELLRRFAERMIESRLAVETLHQ